MDEASSLEPAAALGSRWPRWLKPVARFLTWWLGFFALLGAFSVCPFCGQAGCPGGPASAGLIGGIAAGVMWLPRQIVRRVRHRRRSPCEGSAE